MQAQSRCSIPPQKGVYLLEMFNPYGPACLSCLSNISLMLYFIGSTCMYNPLVQKLPDLALALLPICSSSLYQSPIKSACKSYPYMYIEENKEYHKSAHTEPKLDLVSVLPYFIQTCIGVPFC